jgi:hypothetical protein
MSIGIFSDKECLPKESEILAAVGPAIGRFNELTHWISESLAAQQDLKFMYGRNTDGRGVSSFAAGCLLPRIPRQTDSPHRSF